MEEKTRPTDLTTTQTKRNSLTLTHAKTSTKNTATKTLTQQKLQQKELHQKCQNHHQHQQKN